MKTSLLFAVLLFWLSLAQAQWAQRTSFPGIARAKATSFTLNNKVYLVGGVTNTSVVLNEVWEYDPVTDTWTQLTPFPGPERYGAVSFIINNKAYIATGGNDNGYLDD